MPRQAIIIGAPTGPGAIAKYFLGIGDELVRRGHRVQIICSPASTPDRLQSANVEVRNWPSLRPTAFSDGLFLAKLIARERPSCLIANFGAVNWMCLVGLALRVKHRIAFYHTLAAQLRRDYGDGSLGHSYQSFRKRKVLNSATGIAGISQAALLDAQKSMRVPPGKCQLWRYFMPDPLAVGSFTSAGPRGNSVVCAARLHPSKGHRTLIGAFAKIAPRFSNTRLEFIGEGPLLNELASYATELGLSDQCKFLGQLPHPQVIEKLSQAKVAVVPSLNEAFGLANVEAIAVGTPVIASRVDGIPEIIRDGQDGFLVPPGDAEALALKLTCVLGDHGLADRLSSNARQRFLTDFDQSTVLRGEVDRIERRFAHNGI